MTDDDLLGQDLGDFRIVRRLGAGAMGVVYEAVDRTLQRAVALKVLPEGATRDPERRARLVREARLAASVIHPAVTTIHQVGVVGERVFIAMELIHGQTLRERMNAGALPRDEGLRIGRALASGLGRAHAAGVVHRDVKPDNVMLTGEGQVKILDFGIARLVDGEGPLDRAASVVTAEGHIIGTPGYMSPEQGRGGAIDARSDVFSLGVVLYEIVSGERPFQGATTMDVLIATARDPHPPLSGRVQGIPAALVAVVDRCLAKEPGDRYPSAAEVAEALVQVRPTAERDRSSLLAIDTLGGAAPAIAPAVAPTITGPGAAPPASAARRWRSALVVAGLGGLAALGVWAATGPGESAGLPPTVERADVASVVAPLAVPTSVLACPILETVGVEEPSGWLGAAVASAACGRATIYLGGETRRTRVPAELLDLPSAVSEDAPRDPFDAPDARRRSLAAAMERATAWLDGRVTVSADGFVVELSLETPAGGVARGRGAARRMFEAVAAALEDIVAVGAIQPEPLSERVQRWRGLPDVPLALAFLDYVQRTYTSLDRSEPFARLERSRERLVRLWPVIVAKAQRDGEPITLVAPPHIDDATTDGRAWSIMHRALDEPRAGLTRLADELAALRLATSDERERLELASLEADLANTAGDGERAHRLMLGVASTRPRDCNWDLIAASAWGVGDMEAVGRMQSSWAPENPDAWNILGYGSNGASAERRERMFRRAVLLGADLPLWSLNYARFLVNDGRPVQARSLAARLMNAGPQLAPTADTIFALADAAEARFKKAHDEAWAIVMQRERFGRIEDVDLPASGLALKTAIILGDPAKNADAFAQRFVLATPHRMAPGHFGPMMVTEICVFASPTIAAECLSTLRTLIDQGYFREGRVATTDASLTAAERFAAGDSAAAAEAYRPLLVGAQGSSFTPLLYDAAGEPEVASRIDAIVMTTAMATHGATIAHVREARRACARQDFARCRELAEQVIAAWDVADAKLPAVAEMRALLAQLPPSTSPR